MRGVFEEFGGGRHGHAAVPAHPVPRGDAQVRLRQAGPAQPELDAGRLRRSSAGSGFKAFAGREHGRHRSGHAGTRPAQPRKFFDRMNDFAAGREGPGLGNLLARATDGTLEPARSPSSSTERDVES